MFEFLLKSGEVSIVDSNDRKIVENQSWKLCERGVFCIDGKQTIFLHNMIAPYISVSFKNGNKLDCRRENLLEFRNNDFVKTRVGSNIWHNDKLKFYAVHRKVILNTSKYWFYSRYSYAGLYSQESALRKASEARKFIFDMSREEFVNWKKSRPLNRPSSNNILIDNFDCFKGREISNHEMYQMGISHVYDRDLSE